MELHLSRHANNIFTYLTTKQTFCVLTATSLVEWHWSGADLFKSLLLVQFQNNGPQSYQYQEEHGTFHLFQDLMHLLQFELQGKRML